VKGEPFTFLSPAIKKTFNTFRKNIIVFLKKTMMFLERDDDVFRKRR